MRVLQVNKFLYRKGGAEAYMLDLGDELRAAGHDVAFWGMTHPSNPPYPYDSLFVPESDFESPPDALKERAVMAGRLMYSVTARRRIGRVIGEFQPDVVHAHNIYHQLSPSVLAPAHKNAAVVMTLHDYKLACPVYRFLNDDGICEACGTGRWYEATRRRCTRGMLAPSALNTAEAYLHHTLRLYERHVDVFISPSRFLAEKVIRVGIPEAKVRVVPNFTDADRVEPAFGGEGIVFAGRLSPEKGLRTMIEATALAADRGAEVPLTIYGTGPEETELEQLAAEKAPALVTFAGRRPKEVVAEAMARAGAVVVPSEWYENAPLVVLEALASGTPVIATELGGMPEQIVDGEHGRLVPGFEPRALGDVIVDLHANPGDWAEMGKRGRDRAETEYSKQGHLDTIEGIYAEFRR